MKKVYRVMHMFPVYVITEQGAHLLFSHVQITLHWRSGWVGGDWETRQILHLLNVSVPSSVEWFPPPSLFALISAFFHHPGMHVEKCSKCGGDCACGLGIFGLVFQWSNFSTDHPPSLLQHQTRVYFVQNSCQIVRWGWAMVGDEVILFLFL